MTDNQYILLAIALLIVLREGFQQRDRIKPNEAVSFVWHTYGFIMRFFVFALLFRLGANWITLSFSVLLMWPIYNISCNIGRERKWYYLSERGIDGFIRKLFPFINFDK